MATQAIDRATLHPAASRWIELWNGKQALGWDLHGTPVFRFRWAPAGLATRRQLRAMRMCPGGQEPYALLVWRNGNRWAWLYPARPRPPVPRPVTGPARRPGQGDASAPHLSGLPDCHRLLHPDLRRPLRVLHDDPCGLTRRLRRCLLNAGAWRIASTAAPTIACRAGTRRLPPAISPIDLEEANR